MGNASQSHSFDEAGQITVYLTPERAKRVEATWGGYAGEPVTMAPYCVGRSIHEGFVVFGSELACLRLYYRFHGKGKVEFSKSLGKWVYSSKAER